MSKYIPQRLLLNRMSDSDSTSSSPLWQMGKGRLLRPNGRGGDPRDPMVCTPNALHHLLSGPSHKSVRSRTEIHDAIAVAAITAKGHYDNRHKPIFFNVNDKVLLRLHKGYNIPSAAILGRKLGQQYAGPFRVIEQSSYFRESSRGVLSPAI
ncbi:uncharacterized protein F4812DRAFT_457636 [Daldinia caldariorum]|uniref:uncharacterized protein n=1 Tax=Daldinia caldariorum TaxID=326644 RepID=UPI00200894E6|nr:uncharacterized protein F4812DRAFT_457636 [Daldinia caldariorum]KAI1469091.1 hypothetical protein F4812DRAFT_457636 [Daldinia caldariorum]